MTSATTGTLNSSGGFDVIPPSVARFKRTWGIDDLGNWNGQAADDQSGV